VVLATGITGAIRCSGGQDSVVYGSNMNPTTVFLFVKKMYYVISLSFIFEEISLSFILHPF